MPPGKDRENLHISLPKALKDSLTTEASRRSLTLSDLICEYIERSRRQDDQWRLDLQRVLEFVSQKSDRILAQVETMATQMKSLHMPAEQDTTEIFAQRNIAQLAQSLPASTPGDPPKEPWWKRGRG